MVKIRLARMGRKKDPVYRIVAMSGERKRGGKMLEVLGYWQPRTEKVELKKEKIKAWEEKGAQVSAAVRKLIEK
jgi:small subunit ribosomal protein S16